MATILHVLCSPSLGGCESLCIDLATHLGHPRWSSEVVFMTDADGPSRHRLLERAIPVHNCVYESNHKLRFVREFARLCQARAADSVICYTFGLLHLLVSFGARWAGVRRVIVHMGNPPSTHPVSRLKAALLSQVARPCVTAIAACSEYVKIRAHREYGLPLRSIHTTWNPCNVRQVAKQARAVRKSSAGGGPILGIVSRLDPIKDHSTLFRAFAYIREEFHSARLVVVGDGVLSAELRRLAEALHLQEAIDFRGSRTDIPEQLGELDLFVYATTQNEGFGTVLVEAMAAGVPIVCTEVGPCREVLADGLAGMLCRPHDPIDLARSITVLLSSPDLRAELSSNAYEIAIRRYDVERIAERYEAILER